MAENREMYIFTIDLNLNELHKKFRETAEALVDNHNRWFDETLGEIRRKVLNPSLVSDMVVKTPRQRKRKTVLSTAKKIAEMNTAKKKKKHTLRPSVRKDSSSDSEDPSKENGTVEQKVNRGLFNNDLNDKELTPVISKWKAKQYTRASRAALRETLTKMAKVDAPETKRLTRATRQTLLKETSEESESESKPISSPDEKGATIAKVDALETKRLTRAMRKTLLKHKSEESECEAKPLSSTDAKVSTTLDCEVEIHELATNAEKPIENLQIINTSPVIREKNTGVIKQTPEVFHTPMTRAESENEWLTDDESSHDKYSSPAEPKKIEIKKVPSRRSSQKLGRTHIPTTTRVTRAQARIQQQIGTTDKVITRSMLKKIPPSCDAYTSDSDTGKNSGSSAKSVRCVSRIQGSATKSLTASALKKREEDLLRRRLLLQKSVEKESKVLQKKERFMQQKVLETRKKREQNERRVQQIREQQEKEKEEKRRMELERKEEIERRYKIREENKKARMVDRQKVLAARMMESEQRKAREELDRNEKLQKLEEVNKKKEDEMMKRKQEEDRLAAIIQHHNNSLQHKAVANSFLKKNETQKTSPPKSVMDKTYTLDEPCSSKATCDTYQITPPPKTIKKPPNPANYDITDIKSDDDTDDERKPRKPIPDWAKGQRFIDSLNQQFGKPKRKRDRFVEEIFPAVVLPVDLGDIFQGHRPVSTRYAKRTSSAVWDSAPLKFTDLSRSRSSDSFMK